MGGAACRWRCSSKSRASSGCTTSRGESMRGPVRSTRRSRLTRALASIGLLPYSVAAEDLVQVYRDAQRCGGVDAAARAAVDAGRRRIPQGRPRTLPTLNLSGSATPSRIGSEGHQLAVQPDFERKPSSSGYTLTHAQPLYRPQSWLQYRQV